MSFELHPQLARDCRLVKSLVLSDLLLMNDSRFPWCILVPRVPDLRDLHELQPRDELFDEIELISKLLIDRLDAEKINVAALGNVVPQLHIHVIGRSKADVAWPAPVWSAGPAITYSDEALKDRAAVLQRWLEVQTD